MQCTAEADGMSFAGSCSTYLRFCAFLSFLVSGFWIVIQTKSVIIINHLGLRIFWGISHISRKSLWIIFNCLIKKSVIMKELLFVATVIYK